MPDGSLHIIIFIDVNGIVKPKGIRQVFEEHGL